MKRIIVILLVCVCATPALYAQLTRGKVVSQDGGSVEYVNIGITDTGVGTITDEKGNFELTLPENLPGGILTVTHLSYVPLNIPVGELGDYGDGDLTELVFMLEPRKHEIEEVNVSLDKKKIKKLAGTGTRIPGAVGLFITKGCEVGTVVEVKSDFLVRNFQFKVTRSGDDFTRLRVNVYRVEEDDVRNILYYPMYVDLDNSVSSTNFTVEPVEVIVLEEGKYFISLELVESSGNKGTSLPVYIKGSFMREKTMGPLEKVGVNLGLTAHGYEIN